MARATWLAGLLALALSACLETRTASTNGDGGGVNPPDSLDRVLSQTFTVPAFKLESGEVLPELTLAYETYGRLAPGGRNAILVAHGFTSNHHAAGKYAATDQVVLRVDANGALAYDAALALLRKLELYDIDVAEQPVAIWDLEGLAALCRATSIPIMADESVSTDHSLLEVIRRRAATVVQTKIAKNGGMYRVWRLWTLASAAGMRIYPGNHPSTSVATAAVAQLCAAWPGTLMEGVFAVGVSGALGADIVTEPIVPVNGEIRVPSGPGLGVELDADAIARYRTDREGRP